MMLFPGVLVERMKTASQIIVHTITPQKPLRRLQALQLDSTQLTICRSFKLVRVGCLYGFVILRSQIVDNLQV
jgi:hypothetical protein